MIDTIKELSPVVFNSEFNEILSFPISKLINYNKNNKPIIQSMESLLTAHNSILNYIDTPLVFEDLDEEVAKLKVYSLLSSKIKLSGDVLFFTPFALTRNGNMGLLVPNSLIKQFLLNSASQYYLYGIDATYYDLFFYFYNENIFFGFEHCSKPYYTYLTRGC